MEEVRASIFLGLLLILVSFLQLSNIVEVPDALKLLNISIIFLLGIAIIIFSVFYSYLTTRREEKVYELKNYLDKTSLDLVIKKFGKIKEKIENVLRKKYQDFILQKKKLKINEAKKILKNIKEDLKEISYYKPFLLKFKVVSEDFFNDLNYLTSLENVKKKDLEDFSRSLFNISKTIQTLLS